MDQPQYTLSRGVPISNRTDRGQPANECTICEHTGGTDMFTDAGTYHTMLLLERYVVPLICLFGLVGNTLSTIVFMQKPLRKSSCSFYLAVRSISDNGFLLSLFLVWMSSTFDLKLSQIHVLCKIVVFLTYVCGCVSVWTVVYITFENYIRICHPFTVKTFCTPCKAKLICCVLLVMSLVFYNFPLWITNPDCTPYGNYNVITHALVLIDTLVTLVVPSVVIAVLLIVISTKMLQMVCRCHRTAVGRHNGTIPNRHRSPIVKVTKMLFVVSLVFFVLNLPSHVIRIHMLISATMKGSADIPQVEAVVQISFQLLYYCSFSVNVIIYVAFGRTYSRVLRRMLTICPERRETTQSREAVNMVQQLGRCNQRSAELNEHEGSYFLTVGQSEQSPAFAKEERV